MQTSNVVLRSQEFYSQNEVEKKGEYILFVKVTHILRTDNFLNGNF